jgi:hypothetical protein
MPELFRKASMKSARPLYLLIFPAFLLAFSTLACLSTALVISDIPVFPQATEIPPGTNHFADLLLENMQPITPTTTFSVVGKIYTVPCDTSWVVVQVFYEKALQDKWTVLALDYPELETMPWIYLADWGREGADFKQWFHIMLAVNPDVDDCFLVTALYNEALGE